MRFKCITGDYPWSFRTRGGQDVAYRRANSGDYTDFDMLQTNSAKVAANMGFIQYPPMSNEALADLPIYELADDGCVFILWTVQTRIRESIKMVESYIPANKKPFEYISFAFTWVKTSKALGNPKVPIDNQYPMGTGYWSRCNPEVALLFRRPGAKRASASVRELIFAPNIYHSKKPLEFYKRTEELVKSDYYLDLFSRGAYSDKWVGVGNEVGVFDSEVNGGRPLVGYDIRDTLPLLVKASSVGDYEGLYREFANTNKPRAELVPEYYKAGFNSFDEWLVRAKNVSPDKLLPLKHPVGPLTNNKGQGYLDLLVAS